MAARLTVQVNSGLTLSVEIINKYMQQKRLALPDNMVKLLVLTNGNVSQLQPQSLATDHWRITQPIYICKDNHWEV